MLVPFAEGGLDAYELEKGNGTLAGDDATEEGTAHATLSHEVVELHFGGEGVEPFLDGLLPGGWGDCSSSTTAGHLFVGACSLVGAGPLGGIEVVFLAVLGDDAY